MHRTKIAKNESADRTLVNIANTRIAVSNLNLGDLDKTLGMLNYWKIYKMSRYNKVKGKERSDIEQCNYIKQKQ